MNTEAALAQFIQKAQAMLDEYMAKRFAILGRKVLSVEKGRKYARVVVQYADPRFGGRSVYCFVDLQTGAVLKAASWKAPAKHARGSIFADNPLTGVNPYGANYLV